VLSVFSVVKKPFAFRALGGSIVTNSKRWGAALALVALAAVTGLVRAQDETGVRLEYKWKPGQALRYQMNTNGTITTKMEGLPGGGAGAAVGGAGFPMEMEMTMEMHQQVKEIAADGTATVAQQLKSMTMNNKVMGQQMTAKFDGGKFTMLMNGQPMAMPPGQAAANPGEAMGRTAEMKINRRGQVSGLDGAAREALSRVLQGAQITHVFGPGTLGAGMIVLPEAPTRVGQNWEETQLLRLPAPGMPARAEKAGTPINVNYRVKNTLSKIEPAAGGSGRVAVIATSAETVMPENKVAPPPADAKGAPGGFAMTMRDFKQNVDGTVRFDPDAGLVRGGDYKVNLNMKMEMPFPGAPGGEGGAPAAKPMMGMSGILTLKVALLPESGGRATAAPAR
jgi:hypothetical protein